MPEIINMARKNHDLTAMEQVARIMTNQTEQSHLQTIEAWMTSPLRDSNKINLISDLLEKALGFKYFTQLRARLTEECYAYFLSHLRVEHRERGSVIIDKGKKNDHFYIILQGEVVILDEISCEMASALCGDRNAEIVFQKINSLKPGDTFGEVSLTNPKMLTIARVVAKTGVSLLVASQGTFYRTLNIPQHMKFCQKLQYFRQNILFEGIHQNKIRELLPEVRQIRYNLNEMVYQAGNSHEEMYFVVQGEVQLVDRQRKGFVILGVGEYFGVERVGLDSGARTQGAMSKCQELIVYRVMFKRLVLMDNELHKFMDNLSINLKKKMRFFEEIQNKHQFIEKILKDPNFIKKRKHKKHEPGKSNKPSLQWWGVTNSLNNSRSANARRIRNRLLQQNNKSTDSISNITNQGFTKLDSLIRTTQFSSSTHGRLSLKNFVCPQDRDYIPQGRLEASFQKKTLKQDECEISLTKAQLRKKILPKINKNKLLKYALSDDNYCQKLHLY